MNAPVLEGSPVECAKQKSHFVPERTEMQMAHVKMEEFVWITLLTTHVNAKLDLRVKIVPSTSMTV